MQPWEIRRWNIDDVEQVFGLCRQRQQTCAAFSQPLQNPSVFDTWQGHAALEAMSAGNAHRADIDAHGDEVAQVGNVAQRAVGEMQDIINRLNQIEATITADHMELNESNGQVIDPQAVFPPLPGSPTQVVQEFEMRLGRQKEYQETVKRIMADADQADRDLAMAVDGATGQRPLSQVNPSSPPEDWSPKQLPGQNFRQVDPGTNSMEGLTHTVRYIPMDLPKGWKDDPSNPQTDLGKEYGNTVYFNPKDPGVTGPYTSTLESTDEKDQSGGGDTGDSEGDKLSIPYRQKDTPDGFPEEGQGPAEEGGPEKEGDLEFDYKTGTQLRADSATPTSMQEVTVNGKQYLALDYNYNYSAANTTAAGVNGIDLPTDNAPHWHPLTNNQVEELNREYDVPAPHPGE